MLSDGCSFALVVYWFRIADFHSAEKGSIPFESTKNLYMPAIKKIHLITDTDLSILITSVNTFTASTPTPPIDELVSIDIKQFTSGVTTNYIATIIYFT